MILFKEGVNAREFTQLDLRIKRAVWCMEVMAKWMSLDDLVITSIHRNDNSTHKNPPPYRFVDVAILVNGGMSGSERLRRAINELFPYGKKQNGNPGETIVPLRHGNAPHFHIQCKPE